MPKLPQLKARQLMKVVRKLGFVLRGQEGSHTVWVHPDGRRTTIAIHPAKTIKIGLLTKIIKDDLGMEKEEFVTLLRKKH